MIGFWFRVSTPTPDSGVEDLVDHVSTLKIKVNVGGVKVAARQPPLLLVLDPSTSALVTSCIHVLLRAYLRAQPFNIYKSFVMEIVTALSSHVGCWRRSSGRSFIPIFKTLRASEKPQSITPAREKGRPALRELSSHWMNHEYFLLCLRSGSSSGSLSRNLQKAAHEVIHLRDAQCRVVDLEILDGLRDASI